MKEYVKVAHALKYQVELVNSKAGSLTKEIFCLLCS